MSLTMNIEKEADSNFGPCSILSSYGIVPHSSAALIIIGIVKQRSLRGDQESSLASQSISHQECRVHC